MRIGVLGAGGREHALAWALSRRSGVRVFSLPGNGGTANNVPVDLGDPDDVVRVCRDLELALIVVGPEAPLAAGVADALRDAGFLVVGPGKEGARLESSKTFAKAFMRRHGIPTAESAVAGTLEQAAAAADRWKGGFVLKADGLAAGKGVIVCSSTEEMDAAWSRLRNIRPSGESVLVEERLEGWELSIHAITDGTDVCILPTSQDHKPLLDGDRGPNTGGMGAFSPVAACSDALLQQIRVQVIDPTLAGLREEGIDYRGFIYAGLMVTEDGPKVLEYNVRLGDPETEVLLPAVSSDLVDLFLACAEGRLSGKTLTVREGSFVDIVLASEGYPGGYETGYEISGLAAAGQGAETSDTMVFHAGTRRVDDRTLTAGGRVLNVVAHGATLEEARTRAYAVCDEIHFEGKIHRTDIGRRNRQ